MLNNERGSICSEVDYQSIKAYSTVAHLDIQPLDSHGKLLLMRARQGEKDRERYERGKTRERKIVRRERERGYYGNIQPLDSHGKLCLMRARQGVFVCVCVCVKEREREGVSECVCVRKNEIEREMEGKSECVCVRERKKEII